jgi:hypothetical protein
MAAANLIIPQITITWGKTNLTAYTLPDSTMPEPIAFDAEVSLPSDGNSSPTGSFMWNPSGPAFAVFEKLVAQSTAEPIKIKFWYLNGPEIEFLFYYSGVDISYGIDMSVKVTLSAVSAFKTAATTGSASLNYAEKFNDKGVNAIQAQKDREKVYPNSQPLLYSKCAQKDASKTLIKNAQWKDQSYGSQVQSDQQQQGNRTVLSNIGGEAKLVAVCPFSWEAKQKNSTVEFPPRSNFDPATRYGYLVGPQIITTFNRTVSYSPPTADKDNKPAQPSSSPVPKDQKPAPGTNPGGKPQEETAKGQKPGQKGTQRSSNPSNKKGVQYSENPSGPEKQNLGKEESGIKLTANLFMTPAILGMKVEDVLYVPSLKQGSDQIEDYIIRSVTYSQQGGVFGISVEASRTFGLSKPMYPEEAKKFQEKAQSLKTLDDWAHYAWRERLGLPKIK